ncbi:uncharacterized protein LOC106166787, partial [Lingula anatina]|uniref:Uncharacterized protein LOC106166787 n=1 Tax=Lingula anatina TaxID=7574 RepID=A0A1S3IRR8_LINAN
MTSYSDTPADVRVSTPLHPDYPPVSVSVQKGKETTVSMPRALFKSNATGFATDSILVESSRDIAVFGLAEGPGFSGGYLALPVDVLGQEYVALCSIDSRYSDDYSQHSEIIIIAVESDTRVRIAMPKVEGVFVIYNGSEFTRHRMLEIRLSKYETFHIHSEAFSLTQTFINSDRPIAVISGAREQFGSTKDIVLEMMPPMSAWGRMYTISPRHSEDSNNWTLVILSSRSEQSYVVAQGNNQPTLSITRERHVTYETYAQSLLTITAREHDPILVGVHTSCRHHFQDGTTTGGLDTAVATPFEQTPKNVTFVSAGSRLNGVSMISISYCLKTLTLDGGQVHWNSDLSIGTPMLQLNATTANVDRGTHYISNDQPQEGVLASVYGYGDNVGHAFPAGALYTITHPCHPSITVAGDLVDNDCDGLVDEEVYNHIDDDNDGEIDEDLTEDRVVLHYHIDPWEIVCSKSKFGNIMSLTYDARILWANVSAVYNEGEDAGACTFLHSYATEYRRDVMLDDAAERNRCGIAI